ncbi:MAG: SsrA-binding protein SmpB [Candidatus Cyclobacteriaceae bacterium M2_1C_046]
MSKKKERFTKNINIKNRKASFEYEFLEQYTAGIALKGTEIKSIRQGKVSLQEAYCYFHKGELYVKGMHIAPYEEGNIFNHDPLRDRKLLLQKRELRNLEGNMTEKGLTIIPTRLFISDRGHAKINIALARGKKIHDKRQSIKEKDMKREMEKIKY